MSSTAYRGLPDYWEAHRNRRYGMERSEENNLSWYAPAEDLRDRLNDELQMNEHTYLLGHENFAAGRDLSYAPSPYLAPAETTAWDDWPQDPPATHGYMAQPSPFSLDPPHQTETDFLSLYPRGHGTITFHNENNEMESIREVNVDLISRSCPVLGLAFEDSRSGPQLYLELLTPAIAMPFLRFLYSGTYALSGGPGAGVEIYDDVPTSVLSHCQLYRLGDVYDLPALKTQAYVNVLRQCEFGCSSPDKPIDLCVAIQYVYKELREHSNLIDALLNYCISCFLTHALAIDPEFKQLAYELRVFHQDLCQAVMGRDVEHATALAIIQMPFKAVSRPTHSAGVDIVWQYHGDDDVTGGTKPTVNENGATCNGNMFQLPIRERQDAQMVESRPVIQKGEASSIGKKQAITTTPDAGAAFVGGIAHLIQDEQTRQLVETEYNIVRPSSAEEETSDSGSEAGFVKIDGEDVDMMEPSSVPGHTQHRIENTRDSSATGESDSESEWTML